jgi:universal stress protein A
MQILVAVDDSKFSEAALQAVIKQFRPESTEVHVLHILQPLTLAPLPQMSRNYAPELEAQQETAREFVERDTKLLRAAGLKAQGAVRKGDIRLQIIDAAAEMNADLIVLGSHGRSGLPRLLLGSVAQYVAQNAACSVEIVRLPSSA